MTLQSSRVLRHAAERGFTIVELMIALLIGLFLLGGLLTMVQNNKRTFVDQSGLAQLQDSERLAMTMMTDVIQQSGFFSDPTTYSAASTMPALAGPPALQASQTMGQGQAMSGTYSATPPGDSITVRYGTQSGDGILNCAGKSSVAPTPVNVVNTLIVVPSATDPTNPMLSQLVCTLGDGTQIPVQYPLVNGVTNLTVTYGVNTAGSGNNVDTYMTTDQVINAAAWNNVISVRVALTFINPLNVLGNVPGQPANFVIQRNISVMSRTGI